jgi:predicted DCC family thiol-disulfide oxidoreductase YuxK
VGADQGLTRLFYDGGCGLCHATVRFVARHDPGEHFRFAPLGGATFQRLTPADGAALPDSLVVLTPEGRLLVRSEAVVHLLRGLGGFWRAWAVLLAVVPRPLRDWLYDGVARYRQQLFRRPEGPCPVLPPALRERFDP